MGCDYHEPRDAQMRQYSDHIGRDTMTQQRHSRRGFMGLTGAGLAGVVSAPWVGATTALAAAADADADLVVFNAKVYTIDSRLPRAEAFAAKSGRFTATGTTADIKGLIGKNTQAFDARQM